jgi:hypothetical protein
LKLAFQLSAPTPAEPFTWCALVNRAERDLGGWTGCASACEADGEYRLWVQLRDRNPRRPTTGSSGGWPRPRRRWTGAEVQVPFSRLRTLNPKSDGHVDPNGDARRSSFVLDPRPSSPGRRARSGSRTSESTDSRS